MDESFPTRLRDLLNPAGRKLGLGDAVDSGRVFERWNGIVGDDIAAHVRPTSLREGVLRVTASSPTWATEISYLAEDLVRRINAAVGRPLVTELKVTAGAFEGTDRANKRSLKRPVEVPREAREVDPLKAFEKARRAWADQDHKSRSDQDF